MGGACLEVGVRESVELQITRGVQLGRGRHAACQRGHFSSECVPCDCPETMVCLDGVAGSGLCMCDGAHGCHCVRWQVHEGGSNGSASGDAAGMSGVQHLTDQVHVDKG